MKNTKQTNEMKRTSAANKSVKRFAAWRNLMNFKQLKYTSRQFLSAFFIYALVIVPLLTIPGVVQQAQAQTFCNSATSILQGCPLGNNGTESALTNQAIDDVIALYELPQSERDNVNTYARNEIRAMIYVRLLELINKANPTQTEQDSIAVFTQKIKDKRIEAAQKAKAEYNRFQSTNCRIYHPPSPYTYSPGYACYSPLASSFSGPNVPSFEEFQNFGAVLASGDLTTADAQTVSAQTTTGIAAGAGIAAAGIGAAAAAAIGSTITFGTLAAIIPTAGITFTSIGAATASGTITVAVLPAAGSASGAVGASAAAGPAAIIILALTAAVMEGISVANISQLPGKLDQAIIDKQNETIDIRGLVNGDDAQKQEVYGAFLRLTLPDYPDEETITPDANDSIFTYTTPTVSTTDANSMRYTPWNPASTTENEARLSGRSWFLVRNGNTPSPYRMRLSINYLGENGELLTARRRGREFVITQPNNPSATVITDTLKAKFSNTVFSYKVKPTNPLAVAGQSNASFNCFTSEFDGSNVVTLGRILDTGGTSVNSLILTVNGGASATVGNMTLSNLSVYQDNGTNYISGKATPNGGALPATGDFTIKVENNQGDTQTFTTTVTKTAVIDNLPKSLPAALVVGTNYSFELNTKNGNSTYIGQCSGYSYSITGELPAGLALVNNHQAGANEPGGSDIRLVGTAGSDGDYRFTVNKNYTNGEVLSRTYRIVERGVLAEIPDGVQSWWRAENNAEDFTGRAGGTMFGTATFINSKVSRGFFFRGTNGYVSVPGNAFQIASQSQTFETWFKTGANGVILGRQSGNITPYTNAQNQTRPLIYVDNAGKLRVGFGNGESTTISQNAVNNNSYHHVAVTFSEAGGGAVYLDGVNIGANNGRAFTGSFQKFQFGTGFINPGVTGELSGWANFSGTIDEPAIYNQILSAAQIKAIYNAGAGGKISVKAIPTPPTQRNGSDGTITIQAQGGVRQLSYSVDNGATFQTTNFFQNLTPGTYQTVVRDGGSRDVRRTIIITNPAPNLSFTTQVTAPQCFGGNARIVIFPSGGSGNYEYSVRNGANVQTSNDFTDIGAGDYIPWLHDTSSDTIFTNGTINIPQPSQIVVAPAAFPNAALNQPYSQTFTVSGGTPGYSIGVSGDSQTNFRLPSGLTQSVSGNTVTISGTPTQIGNFNTFFEVYDRNSCRQGVFVPLVITSNQTYNINGRATNGGQALANVTITLNGAETRTTTTDASGNYSFATVAGSGDYTVTATLNGATFAQPTTTLNNLSANLTGIDFATATTTYEGDFAPRGSGDGLINVLDLVALGRTIMPNNPDAMPANGAEFQRADTNPRSTLGNGIIDANDLTQIRNYIVNVIPNPKTPAGGAIAPASNLSAAKSAKYANQFLAAPNLDSSKLKIDLPDADAAAANAATISADTVNYTTSANVRIRLNSTANVQAAQFTIVYDTNKLSLFSVSSANAPANTTVLTNRDQPGKVQVIVSQPINGAATFAAGDVDLLTLGFSRVQNATGFARVDFSDAPMQLLASDPNANAVTLNSTPGGVTLSAAYGIAGKITNGGQGLSNVAVTRTGNSQTVSTTTDASGNYYFDNLTNGGNYTISAALNGYTFTPATLVYNNLNANLTNADFSTSQPSYEGDIAGRPTGDGAVNVLDLVGLGRIIGGLDAPPANGAEYQRADVAPLESRGDGAINVRDLVQLGRYIGSLDAPNSASGAVAPVVQARVSNDEEYLSKAGDEAEIEKFAAVENTSDLFTNDQSKIDSINRQSAQTAPTAANLSVGPATVNSANAVVPINLNSNADTAAIQFSIEYDAAKLSIPNDAAIVNRYPNTTFVINRSTPGKLGIVAYQPLDGATVFPAGQIKLFDINFTVANGASGVTDINFTSDPVALAASSPNAVAVSVAGANGSLTLLAPTAATAVVSGRIVVGERGLVNAVVNLTDLNGSRQTARTNPFGYYRFPAVVVGETYVISVTSKNYSFESRVISVFADTDNLDFAALP